MIAYLINLKRANDRLVSAKEAFDKAGINFNLEVAVDGKELSLPHRNYSELKYNLFNDINITRKLIVIDDSKSRNRLSERFFADAARNCNLEIKKYIVPEICKKMYYPNEDSLKINYSRHLKEIL